MNKLYSPSSKNALCQVCLKFSPLLQEKKNCIFVNISFEKGLAHYLKKVKSPSPNNALWKVWLKVAHDQLFWRIRYSYVFLLFRNYISLEKGVTLYLNNLRSPFTEGCFVPSLVEIGQVVLENGFLKSMYFWYFLIISPWKRAWPFIWAKSNSNL